MKCQAMEEIPILETGIMTEEEMLIFNKSDGHVLVSNFGLGKHFF